MPADASASLTVNDILDRCAGKYQRLRTIRALGLFRDYRGRERKVQPIRWDYVRPDRCRLQIGMDLALIVGKGWWTYDTEAGTFRSHHQITATPIETAGTFLSGGVAFLLPAALKRGRGAFRWGPRDEGGWRLDGTAWIAGRPCYRLSRAGPGHLRSGRLKLWIDQDQFLIRSWALDLLRKDGRERTAWGCTYLEVAVDELIPASRFRPNKPTPILIPRGEPTASPPPSLSPP
ncbi:MAG: hypothetical protein ACE5E1_11095 [Phycisphaerae bacterium]